MPIVHSIPLALSRLVTLERPKARPQPARVGHFGPPTVGNQQRWDTLRTREIRGLMEVL